MNEIGPAQWRLERPGRMVLPDTGYAITWDGLGSFIVTWNDNKIGAAGALEGAQDHAMWHMKSMLKMGLRPEQAD